MRRAIPILCALLALSRAGGAQWVQKSSGTTADLRGLSVVSETVVWASGSGGTVLRTTDGGATWRADTVPGAAALDFRDVEAMDASTAYVLSAGEGERSRIYKTSDGGRSWTLQFTNREPAGFFDAIDFWDAEHGIAFGDPVGGRFMVVTTDDGGRTWTPVLATALPPALPGEAAFAASGTSLVVRGARDAWFATGGGARARVFRSRDRGRSWTVTDTPVSAGGPSSGIFSLVFRDARRGVAVGGDYARPAETGVNAAITDDGGRSWRAARSGPGGYRSAIAVARGRRGVLLAVGPTGSDVSLDGGVTWSPLDSAGFNSVAFTPAGRGGGASAWAVGPKGKIAHLDGVALRERARARPDRPADAAP